MKPHGRVQAAALGVRFDREDKKYVYPLGGRGKQQRAVGSAVDISRMGERAHHIDLPFVVEADLGSPVAQSGLDDLQTGQLVAGQDGAALVARFTHPGGFPFLQPISLLTWTGVEESNLDTLFANWRLRIGPAGSGAIYHDPSGATGAAAE